MKLLNLVLITGITLSILMPVGYLFLKSMTNDLASELNNEDIRNAFLESTDQIIIRWFVTTPIIVVVFVVIIWLLLINTKPNEVNKQ